MTVQQVIDALRSYNPNDPLIIYVGGTHVGITGVGRGTASGTAPFLADPADQEKENLGVVVLITTG